MSGGKLKGAKALGARAFCDRAAMALAAVAAAFAAVVAATGSATAAAADAIPTLSYDSTPDLLTLPDDLYLGEVAGVATNSKGHLFVYTRTGSEFMTVGAARNFVHGGSRLFEFDDHGKYVREIGAEIYGFLSAHAVRVDAQDNVWVVDEGSYMVIKFAPDGRELMTLGRKPEAVGVPARAATKGPGLGIAGDTFDGPTDVGWDSRGNIFVADGSGNARIVKLDPHGAFIKAWGGRGSGPGQFNDIHTLAVDAQGNVYVGDRGNSRIQVFDNDGQFKTQIQGIGVPAAICITPGAHPYLYTSNSNSPVDMEHGEIYRLELDGRILGKFGTAGKRLKQFGSVHEIDCREPNTLFVAELGNWRVQKLSLKGP
jgi:DNA-binding beta-propeller fold protein YncE